MNNSPSRSNIWNIAWNNQTLIQKNCFWEIRNGQDSLFWDDAWQQQPRWSNQDSLHKHQNNNDHQK
jgi:hypothetical protein